MISQTQYSTAYPIQNLKTSNKAYFNLTKSTSYTLMLKYILKYNKKSISISITFINAFKISKNKKDPQKCESYNSYYTIFNYLPNIKLNKSLIQFPLPI